ncbi:translation elongation factor 4, partial [Candidatus Saccharibacteria bacterium]|nr:translation elongation factor 4 [Candidatus Saccharibacteria bacterium]
MNTKEIRNLCIIAHIDHGKSTLADRLLEITGTVQKREMRAQMLDGMDLEREKGITIKLTPVRMNYKGHTLNLIDTPGHVDFSYEVSRSLAAVEGALLVVDASQGIQAQTLANVYLAIEHDLTIIPVLNKIDLPAADPDRVAAEVMNLLGCKREDIIEVSAKTGKNVEKILDAVVEQIPSPVEAESTKTRALVFDSFYDEYRGVILYLRVFDGELPNRSSIKMIATEAEGEALELGALVPKEKKLDKLERGQIGYVVTNLKSVAEARVGDTLTLSSDPADNALAGYQEVKPFVYAGLYPSSADEYPQLKDALSKLKLSDAALVWDNESSAVLGNGFRVGFLGLLHMEIVKERLERDNNIELIITNPSTDYEVSLTLGEEMQLKSAGELPDPTQIEEIREPWIKGEIVVPKKYLGSVLELIVNSRGLQDNISYLDDLTTLITFKAPLANMLTDFYDNLKSSTSGYGSFNYELI